VTENSASFSTQLNLERQKNHFIVRKTPKILSLKIFFVYLSARSSEE